jgi:hypothetical protein
MKKILNNEAALQLEWRVDNKFFPLKNKHRNFGSVSFLLRRDDVFGPAHILFRMYDPLQMPEGIRFRIGVSGHPSVEVESIWKSHENIHIFKKVEAGISYKKKGCKLYGRLRLDSKSILHEGGSIPAECLRKFFEPEYFPELFFAIDGLQEKAFPFYPTLDFLIPGTAAAGCEEEEVMVVVVVVIVVVVVVVIVLVVVVVIVVVVVVVAVTADIVAAIVAATLMTLSEAATKQVAAVIVFFLVVQAMLMTCAKKAT